MDCMGNDSDTHQDKTCFHSCSRSPHFWGKDLGSLRRDFLPTKIGTFFGLRWAHKSGDRRQLLGYQVRVSRYLKKSPDSGSVTLQFWAVIRYYKCYKPIYHHFWCWCCCLRSSCATSALRDSKWAKTLVEPTFIWNISIWIIHHIDICMWVICMYIYIFFYLRIQFYLKGTYRHSCRFITQIFGVKSPWSRLVCHNKLLN